MSTSVPSGASSVELLALRLWLKPPGWGCGLTVPGWLAWLSLTRRMFTGALAPGTSWPSRLAEGCVEKTSRLAWGAPPMLQVSRKWKGPDTPSSICEVWSRNFTPPDDGARVFTTWLATFVASDMVNGHCTMNRVGAVTGVDGMRTRVPSLNVVGRRTLKFAVGTLGSSGTDGIVGNMFTRANGLGRDPIPLGNPTLGGFSLHDAELVAVMALRVPTVRVSTPTDRSSDCDWADALVANMVGRITARPARASSWSRCFLIELPLLKRRWLDVPARPKAPFPGGRRRR